MVGKRIVPCPDCEPVSRRDFLKVAGTLAVAGTVSPVLLAGPEKAVEKTGSAESFVAELHKSLTPDQKKILCFSFDDPLRKKVQANWAITEPTIDELEPVQQDLVEKIVRGLSSEEGFEKFMRQMADDHGGLGSYHFAIFGEPGSRSCEFVLTGRHVTMRADGNAVEGAAFGGPMVYGHAASGFVEKPTHPGNVFWYQAKRANEVFGALDPKQREKALIEQAPEESDIAHKRADYGGLAAAEMSSDQKELLGQVMRDLLSPYREADADEVMQIITANGGIEKIHLAFFRLDADGKNGDLGNNSIWDIWRLEGPGFVWHFRGAPHVHTWVNIAKV